MTLKEKFKEEKIYINPYTFKLTIESAEIFEQIADDYAIDFSAWLFTRTDINLKNKNLKELLGIFKKENLL